VKNKMFVLLLVFLAIGGFFLLKKLQPNPAVNLSPSPSVSENFIRPHSPSFGNSLGRTTVIEWFDPECESCRMIHPILKQIISEYKDRVHFVFRYMPYHENSMFAAAALEEARELGKYEEALDILFERQPEWGNHHAPRPELISELLAKLGIPKSKLEKNYLIEKHSKKIRMNESDGKAVGVRGTPTFFVNGHMLQELGEEPLRAAIKAALGPAN
jgi:protein-disulfide isomerase